MRPNVAFGAFNAPKATLGASNAPKATLGRIVRGDIQGEENHATVDS